MLHPPSTSGHNHLRPQSVELAPQVLALCIENGCDVAVRLVAAVDFVLRGVLCRKSRHHGLLVHVLHERGGGGAIRVTGWIQRGGRIARRGDIDHIILSCCGHHCSSSGCDLFFSCTGGVANLAVQGAPNPADNAAGCCRLPSQSWHWWGQSPARKATSWDNNLSPRIAHLIYISLLCKVSLQNCKRNSVHRRGQHAQATSCSRMLSEFAARCQID